MLGNAIKFTKKGHIHFRVSCSEQSSETEEPLLKNKKILCFEVEDTGVGIDQANLNKLFKAFGKLDDKAGLNKHGVGLGLMISKDIIESLQGKISIESQFGIGTIFKF